MDDHGVGELALAWGCVTPCFDDNLHFLCLHFLSVSATVLKASVMNLILSGLKVLSVWIVSNILCLRMTRLFLYFPEVMLSIVHEGTCAN